MARETRGGGATAMYPSLDVPSTPAPSHQVASLPSAPAETLATPPPSYEAVMSSQAGTKPAAVSTDTAKEQTDEHGASSNDLDLDMHLVETDAAAPADDLKFHKCASCGQWLRVMKVAEMV